MKSRRWDGIINIASLQSMSAFESGIAYCAAKGSIVQLTRAMAEAWSSNGFTANAVAPGFLPTELTVSVFSDPQITSKHAAQTAITRSGVFEDLRALTFLASNASAHVTGQTIMVDGLHHLIIAIVYTDTQKSEMQDVDLSVAGGGTEPLRTFTRALRRQRSSCRRTCWIAKKLI